jgi:fructose-specific component phosphotransferase system IIB-like protein
VFGRAKLTAAEVVSLVPVVLAGSAAQDGKEVVTDTSEAFLKPPATLREGVAAAAPTIDSRSALIAVRTS